MPFGWKRKENASVQRRERKHLRQSAALACEVEAMDGKRVEAQVVDLTIEGARLRIQRADADHFSIDQVLELKISGPKGAWQVKSRAKVRHLKNVSADWTHVGFMFVDIGYLLCQMENALSAYFNRRAQPRMCTQHESEFFAKLRLGRAIETARVVNLSRTGLALVLGSVQAMPFTPGSTINVRFTIPGTKDEQSVQAVIRHRRRVGDETWLGLELEHSAAQKGEASAQAIDRYIEKLGARMEKILRKLSA